MSDKWVILSTRSKVYICGSIWDACKQARDVEHRIFESESALLDDVAGLDDSEFSRVIVDANLRRMGRRSLTLGRLSNLIVFDHDICQQYSRYSDWYRKYIPVIKSIGARRSVVSSETLRQDMLSRGMDVELVLKGYDPQVISGLASHRDIPAAFIGRVSNKVYRARKKMLKVAEKRAGVRLLKTEPGESYNQLLHRVAVFVSADVGFNEYMIKNYEAMAAGCALLAWRQPEREQKAIGIEDGVNAMLYDSEEELLEKLALLQGDVALREKIAKSGQSLVEKRHSWEHRGQQLQEAIAKPFAPESAKISLSDRLALAGRL